MSKVIPFNEKTTTLKGNIGEKIVTEWLDKQGHAVYAPIAKDKAHPTDRIVIHKITLKVMAAEIKTKPRRYKYPDTGIDMRHFGKYKSIEEINCMPVFLFFVDEVKGEIYGNLLSELMKKHDIVHNGKILSYPRWERGIIYFSLQSMKKISDLPKCESEKLISLRKTRFTYLHDSVQGSLNL